MQRMGVTWHAVFILYLQVGGLLGCGCCLQNITLHVDMHRCGRCMAINTTICSGFCHTQDTNLKGFEGKRFLIQQGCVYHSMVYHVAKMPGCPAHTDPLFFYPVAQHCHCGRCNTKRMECIRPVVRNATHCSKYLRPV
ncbi:hypothetical protein ACEWY4_000651 [Coilia grayii]|uniref:Glycoprotein hormone subunit beta domain-containing protein n=1 Tax=Coilia grayii TaxID=363190 RepID=A0ABD1KXA4_9TELE